jgi:hypothetical protein
MIWHSRCLPCLPIWVDDYNPSNHRHMCNCSNTSSHQTEVLFIKLVIHDDSCHKLIKLTSIIVVSILANPARAARESMGILVCWQIHHEFFLGGMIESWAPHPPSRISPASRISEANSSCGKWWKQAMVDLVDHSVFFPSTNACVIICINMCINICAMYVI